MEVSHASTEMQSAAIGIKGKAEEVTVSTDAEFMMTIAHGIYSNKALALVRELLCNARDGHAKAGKLDVPIHVTLTDNKLVVRDHGTGIPNDIFAKTYMTFGKSTKRKDASATGGFGVGTKVPWAVCDVFSGRNWIDGTMTAYSIVKMDPTMEGKPTCTPVMSIPSTEPCGVEVSVPFPEKMHDDIRRYLLHFISELGIPVVFNGQPQSFSAEFNSEELRKVGYTRLPHHPRTTIQQSPFYVRQGDVIYPIECQEEFEDAFTLLNYLNQGSQNPILFMAEPDSIIPTLSRESLQYTDRTSKSIRDLMKKALQVLGDNVDAYADRTQKLFPEYLAKQPSFLFEKWKNKFEPLLYLESAHKRFLADPALSQTQNLLLMHNMSRWLSKKTPYLESLNIIAKDFREHINTALTTLFMDKLRVYHYFNYDKLVEVWAENRANSYYTKEHLIALKRNTYEEVMFWRQEIRSNTEISEVYLQKRADFYQAMGSSRASFYFIELSELKDIDTRKENTFEYYDNYLNNTLYVSNTVIISGTHTQMLARALEKYDGTDVSSNVFSGRLGRLVGARFVRIRATTKPAAIASMKREYEARGYNVIVLMDPTKAEIAQREADALERAKLKEIPLPQLHELVIERLPSFPSVAKSKNIKKIKHLVNNPAFKGEPMYLILPRSKELPSGMTTTEDYVRLIKYVGTDIICVSTKAEIAKVLKEKRKSVEEMLLSIVKQYYKTPGLHEKLFYKGTFFVRRASQNRYLTKYLFNRIPSRLTKQEENILQNFKDLGSLFTSIRSFLTQKENFYRRCCTPETHYNRLFERYAISNFCDVSRALDMAYARKPSRQRALARSIMKNILKERPA